ncbi:50S ribosomal protein L24 [Blattabacterium cuenoti]|uniref:50S ribosomal protein L24 n=1 Tax=Blattabacterium cuenoti TaxID=1653831 RepID=UPI00163CA920|nr:50S ribosomal protein L24 [Blattabacterium cuenoti]
MKKLKKGNNVIIIYGNHKGKKGVIKKILTKSNKAIIDGVNMIKKHIKPELKNPKGKILKKESPIHISNLKKL